MSYLFNALDSLGAGLKWVFGPGSHQPAEQTTTPISTVTAPILAQMAAVPVVDAAPQQAHHQASVLSPAPAAPAAAAEVAALNSPPSPPPEPAPPLHPVASSVSAMNPREYELKNQIRSILGSIHFVSSWDSRHEWSRDLLKTSSPEINHLSRGGLRLASWKPDWEIPSGISESSDRLVRVHVTEGGAQSSRLTHLMVLLQKQGIPVVMTKYGYLVLSQDDLARGLANVENALALTGVAPQFIAASPSAAAAPVAASALPADVREAMLTVNCHGMRIIGPTFKVPNNLWVMVPSPKGFQELYTLAPKTMEPRMYAPHVPGTFPVFSSGGWYVYGPGAEIPDLNLSSWQSDEFSRWETNANQEDRLSVAMQTFAMKLSEPIFAEIPARESDGSQISCNGKKMTKIKMFGRTTLSVLLNHVASRKSEPTVFVLYACNALSLSDPKVTYDDATMPVANLRSLFQPH
jgi:hypothetical protein